MSRAIRSTAAVQSVRSAAHNLLLFRCANHCPMQPLKSYNRMQMQLASSAAFPEPLLAAMPQLREKPRLGFSSKNLAPHQGHEVCNSTTALGFRAALHLERIRSRYTGKERDSESGNDYFGARYYASSMGRFLSPDWSAKAEPVPYAKLDNPQSLNLYTYALNNPLRNIDKDGHCDSSANATANTKCQDVSNLHVNDAMKQKIKQTEGLPGTKGDPALKVYKDGAGNLTVGWGHKVTAADGLKLGDTIKTDQAQKMFDSDLSSKESSVASTLTSNGGHQFSQGEFNALVDLTYNAGPGALSTSMSPSLMKDMNAGDYTGMSGQLRYTKDSAGNVEPGLVTRSDDRKAIFLGADPDSQ
jgi:RHS repeat-associated protein